MQRISVSFLISLIKLTKPVITLSVAFSALTGFVLQQGQFVTGWINMYLGVLLIAASSSVINMIQEAKTDALMTRTGSRPIPAGIVKKSEAWVLAALLSVSGLSLLWFHAAPTAAIIALITLLWYNAIYTPLKIKTPWAIFPGAVVGALPPAIGWVAAGGYVFDPKIIFLSFFFFIGQVPHFWLILLRHGEDYQKAGFPSLPGRFTETTLSRLTFTWTVATSTAAISLIIFGILVMPVTSYFLVIISILLILAFAKWPGVRKPEKVDRAFLFMNIYFLLIMITIIIDSLWRV